MTTSPPLDELANSLAEGLETGRRAPPVVLVVFGASGDLTARKLLPALERLAAKRLLGPSFAVVGVARTEMDDEAFRARAVEAVEKPSPAWEELVRGFRYVSGDYADPATFVRLREVLDEVDRDRGTQGNRVHYLATVPEIFAGVAASLSEAGLARPEEGSFVRVVIEKPFGRDFASADALDHDLHAVLDERQIYRIDHYLGKETVQNVLALRFANVIFEPVWNRNFVDSVQITVAESIGVGSRGGFYETAGALRDIVQNHVLQVLALTCMEPPVTIDAKGIRDEKVKALRSVEIFGPDAVAENVVRAQYDRGWVGGEEVPGYREEGNGVAPDSTTETYVAMRLSVDNWRWAGVPFYVRTGKRLPKRVTEVAMEFSSVPHLPFAAEEARGLERNALVVRVQPDEGITLRFGAKVPGQAFEVRTTTMDFSYGAAFLEETPEAYERLLLDAMVGDPTLFIRTDEVQQAWRVADPVLEAWAQSDVPPARYPAGSWGPAEADRLLARDGRRWRRP